MSLKVRMCLEGCLRFAHADDDSQQKNSYTIRSNKQRARVFGAAVNLGTLLVLFHEYTGFPATRTIWSTALTDERHSADNSDAS